MPLYAFGGDGNAYVRQTGTLTLVPGASLRPISQDTGDTIPADLWRDAAGDPIAEILSDANGEWAFQIDAPTDSVDYGCIDLGVTPPGGTSLDEKLYRNILSPTWVRTRGSGSGGNMPTGAIFTSHGTVEPGDLNGLWTAPSLVTITKVELRVKAVAIGGDIGVMVKVIGEATRTEYGPYVLPAGKRRQIDDVAIDIPASAAVTMEVVQAAGTYRGDGLTVTLFPAAATVAPSVPGPGANTGLNVTQSGGQNSLTWSAGSGALEHQITRAVGGAEELLALVASTTYVDVSPPANSTYRVTPLGRDDRGSDVQSTTVGGGGSGGGTSTIPVLGAGQWLSGAASPSAANGSYGTWRGEAIRVGGTWNDTKAAQAAQWTVQPGAEWGGGASQAGVHLDVAIGAIYKNEGETWAAAASGAYDTRIRQALNTLKTAWGTRDTALLWIRIAHEFNGDWFAWSVLPSEAANFITAWRRWFAICRDVMPKAHLVWSVNYDSKSNLDIRNCWPGSDYVDLYTVDLYNHWPHVTSDAGFTAAANATMGDGSPRGLFTHRQQAQTWGVPFGISEWSNHGDANNNDPGEGGGGDNGQAFVLGINNFCRTWAIGNHSNGVAGRVVIDVQFNLWTQYAFYPTTIQAVTAAYYAGRVWGQ